LFLSAALHLPVAALAMADFGGRMMLAAVVLSALGVGVYQQRRWVAYPAFLMTIFGISAAIFCGLESDGTVVVLLWLIGLADLLAAGVLFVLLWHKHRALT
jgi:hypothetical protein